jgi:hypothetical protein
MAEHFIMGTRSNTIFVSNGDQLVNVYRHFDGYLEGHGRELANFLNSIKLVNGLTGQSNVANGLPCLAAQFICKFKSDSGAGGIYIDSHIAKPNNDFTYVVSGGLDDCMEPLPLEIDVFKYETHIFSGNVQEFLELCSSDDETEEIPADKRKDFSQLVG